MRHVDMQGLTVPPAWAAKTKRTLDAVRAAMAASTEREFTTHWTEDAVRDLILELVGVKCWYCETLIVRADVTVDHYRPKSEVLDVPGHPGYWWLAYDVSNYRIACKHCNSDGACYNGVREGRAKGSQFPLLAGARARTSVDDLEHEQPVLLDPAHQGDPDLLGFDSAGYARRSNTPYSRAEAARGLCRADETIRILALNDSHLVPLRSRLMREVSVLARFGDEPDLQRLIDDKVGPKAAWSSAAAAPQSGVLPDQRAFWAPDLRCPRENIWLRNKRYDANGQVKSGTGGACYPCFPAKPAPSQHRVLRGLGILGPG